MISDGEFCYISSMDGIVSVWDMVQRVCIKTLCMDGVMVMAFTIHAGNVYFSLPNMMKVYDKTRGDLSNEAPTQLTLLQVTTCRDLIWGIDKNNPLIIRAFTLQMKHSASQDFVCKSSAGGFNNLISYQDKFLILSTRETELIVFDVVHRTGEAF